MVFVTIANYVNSDPKYKETLINQTKELQQAAVNNDNQFNGLMKRLAVAKTTKERNAIKSKMIQLNIEFMAIQKLNEGIKLKSYTKSFQYYDEAIQLFTELIKLNPDNAKFYSYRGKAYHYYLMSKTWSKNWKTGNEEEALKQSCVSDFNQALTIYNKTIEVNPNNGIAYVNRGDFYIYSYGLFYINGNDWTAVRGEGWLEGIARL